MFDRTDYPYCCAVQEILEERCIADAVDYEGELGMVLDAYENKHGCLNESVWDIEELEQNITKKFRYAIMGVLKVLDLGEFDKDLDIIVEPSYEDVTMYTVQDHRGNVLLHSYSKAWHFGHDSGGPDDLEKFFRTLASEIKPPPTEWIHGFLGHTRAVLDEAEDMARDLDLTITFHVDLGFVIHHGDDPRHDLGYDPNNLFVFMRGYGESNQRD